MKYTNLNEILERVKKFNKMSDDILKCAEDSLYEVEQYILFNESLINIIKISRILKTAYAEDIDFNEIKNVDPKFKCGGDDIFIKFEDCPFDYYLSYTDYDGDERFWGNFNNDNDLPERHAPDLKRFFKRVLNYIPYYEKSFIKKLNDILEKQDADYDEFCSFYLEWEGKV